MTDHELLHPDAVPVHRQHVEADEDTDFICPGERLLQEICPLVKEDSILDLLESSPVSNSNQPAGLA